MFFFVTYPIGLFYFCCCCCCFDLICDEIDFIYNWCAINIWLSFNRISDLNKSYHKPQMYVSLVFNAFYNTIGIPVNFWTETSFAKYLWCSINWNWKQTKALCFEIDNPCAKKIKINGNQLVDSRGTLVCDMNLQNTFR